MFWLGRCRVLDTKCGGGTVFCSWGRGGTATFNGPTSVKELLTILKGADTWNTIITIKQKYNRVTILDQKMEYIYTKQSSLEMFLKYLELNIGLSSKSVDKTSISDYWLFFEIPLAIFFSIFHSYKMILTYCILVFFQK